jgi:hypothetical protein
VPDSAPVSETGCLDRMFVVPISRLANSEVVPKLRQLSPPSASFPIHNSLLSLRFDAV